MLPSEWETAKALFHEAIALPHQERMAFVRRAVGTNQALLEHLESLLAAHHDSEDFLETPAAALHVDAVPHRGGDALPSNGRIGRYRLIKEIGRGGMGAVYLATRDDGEFTQQVALKLVKRGMDTDAILARFRRERQMLAALAHPNIARLLDGGTTEDGVPYFVMEYVEGKPIGTYCAERHLSTREQLTLFRTVCAAVQHAHQNLIVHRDIKSGNILVSDDGVPKLLDFGIAKLLDPDRENGSTAPLDTVRAMTPEYASPEQIRGESVTTATDVYSLGVLLYELLTGRRPFDTVGMPPEELQRVVCNTDAPPPSATTTLDVSRRRALRGDLDTIVLKAMQKEPSRRYRSVEAFAHDIERLLAGRPVAAQRDTLRYRATKCAQRNRAGLSIAALLLVSLVGGLGATLWQARVANEQRARAERRFADVRELATSFLFEAHDAIANLPGSTPARALLVNRGLKSLDALAREAAGDTLLERELAAAYQRVGLVQGNSYNSNLGDSEAALKSYRASVALLERSIAPTSSNPSALAALANGYDGLATMLNITGDLKGAIANLDLAVAAQKRAVSLDTANVEYRKTLADLYYQTGDARGGAGQANIGDTKGALGSYRAAVALRESLQIAVPKDVEVRGGLANTLFNLGALEVTLDDTLGVQHIRRGVGILEQIIADNPNDAFRRVNLLSGYMKLRRPLAEDGKYAESITLVRKVLAALEPMVAADPTNSLLARNLGVTFNAMGQDLLGLGDANGAVAQHQKALAIAERLHTADLTSVEFLQDLAFTHGLLADALLAEGNVARSIGSYRRAVSLKQALRVAEPADPKHVDDVAPLLAGLGRALDRIGDVARADSALAAAVPVAEAAMAREWSGRKARTTLAVLYSDVGEVHARRAGAARTSPERAAHCTQTVTWSQKGLVLWQQLKETGRLPGAHRARPDMVSARIAECSA